MSQLTLSRLKKSFSGTDVIKGVDLEVSEGEFVVFVGPSGCGKSTLLRMIAGLEEVTSGDIVIAGKTVNDLPPVKRGIAMVFQSYALYPHMTVFENIAFPLRVEKRLENDIRTRVEAAARVLQLDTRLEQKPGTLSGGQRQRVAIGRAIVREPKIFLFDEPLSNLDAALRSDMRIELTRLHKKLGATMIYVTHDQVEALTMADKIVVLNAGRIEQVGSPLDLYHRPQNRFVAGFIGNPKMNFLEGTCTAANASGVSVDLGPLGTINLPRAGAADLVGKRLTVGIRPEHVRLGSDGAFAMTLRPGIIERLGIHTVAYSQLPNGDTFIALFEGDPVMSDDADVAVSIVPADCHLFDAEGQAVARPA
ncbi:sn-glycerol-3-phosphate ABC transporter ATP-binding protein UgpC [Kaistia dalseonensis]|uniref:Multiple sugar transport system ATP-binding protein n=1 Tax=Kaistia dalseonensis TaxID=410840 RepID=A0ABU0H6F6_9HYPH|nr:sn-glycerol-3-phosphate ABC transporter ATP-binding protein UgpC [Kaistia dalseonensis]MCX5495298.1 sn-glycerol-3-phosphate ABC transporter ATP-binding protein UgpC [Kaistia dalseonensis]MDQ0437884.1 multiple sugar transport system ATP-binding protein [Kaistia dalseonensis]